MRKWGLLNNPVVWPNLRDSKREKQEEMCELLDTKTRQKWVYHTCSEYQVVASFQTKCLNKKHLVTLIWEGGENSPLNFPLDIYRAFALILSLKEAKPATGRKRLHCNVSVCVVRAGGRQLALNLKHHFARRSRFQGRYEHIPTWLWIGRLEQKNVIYPPLFSTRHLIFFTSSGQFLFNLTTQITLIPLSLYLWY